MISLSKKFGSMLGVCQDIWPYAIGQQLGEGQQGSVYLGINTLTQESAALKRLPAVLGEDGHWHGAASIRRELCLLQYLQHQNIVFLKDVITCAGKLVTHQACQLLTCHAEYL